MRGSLLVSVRVAVASSATLVLLVSGCGAGGQQSFERRVSAVEQAVAGAMSGEVSTLRQGPGLTLSQDSNHMYRSAAALTQARIALGDLRPPASVRAAVVGLSSAASAASADLTALAAELAPGPPPPQPPYPGASLPVNPAIKLCMDLRALSAQAGLIASSQGLRPPPSAQSVYSSCATSAPAYLHFYRPSG